MMTRKAVVVPVVAGLLLSACATIPTGPTVMVLPGGGKSFEQFQGDDAVCRQWAFQQSGATSNQTSTQSTVSGAAGGIDAKENSHARRDNQCQEHRPKLHR